VGKKLVCGTVGGAQVVADIAMGIEGHSDEGKKQEGQGSPWGFQQVGKERSSPKKVGGAETLRWGREKCPATRGP